MATKRFFNRKGLSDMVTVGLIILLAIAGVVIIWSFVRPAISGVGEKISSGCITFEIEPLSCINNTAVDYDVKVRRGADSESLVAVTLVFKNASGESEVIKLQNCIPNTLETRICTATLNFVPVSVGVAGVIDSGSGTRTCSLSSKEAICSSFQILSSGYGFGGYGSGSYGG